MAAEISPKEEDNIKLFVKPKNGSWESGAPHQATEAYCRVMCEARSIPVPRMAVTKHLNENSDCTTKVSRREG